MEDLVEDPIQQPPLPKGFTPDKKGDSQPLPKGFTPDVSKKKIDSAPISQNSDNGLGQYLNGVKDKPLAKTPQDYKNIFDSKALTSVNDKKFKADLDNPSSDYYKNKTATREKEEAELAKIPLSDKIKSLSNSVIGGSADILKGAVRQASAVEKWIFNPNDPRGKNIRDKLDVAAKDISENYIQKGADKASFNLPDREKELLNSKGVTGALNGFVNYLPAMAAAERTGGASLFFNDYEKGYEDIDKRSKEQKLNLSEGQKQQYANMRGLVSAVVMTHGVGSFIKATGEKTEQVILDRVSQDVIGDMAKSGEDASAGNIHKAINVQLDKIADRVKDYGIKSLKSLPTSVADMAGMEALNIGTEKLINTATGKKVFDMDNIADRMQNAVKNGVLFHAAGSILRAPMLLSKGGEQLNSVVDNLYKDPSEENKNAIKEGLTQYLSENGLPQEDIDHATNVVDNVHKVVRSLPQNLPDGEVAKSVENGLNLEQQKTALGAQISDIDKQLESIPKEETDPVKSAENEVKLEGLTKQREELTNGLKKIITDQNDHKEPKAEVLPNEGKPEADKSTAPTDETTENSQITKKQDDESKNDASEKSKEGQSESKTSGKESDEKSVAGKENDVVKSGAADKTVPDNYPYPKKSVEDMTSDEIYEHAKSVKAYQKGLDKEFFGEDGAKEYQAAVAVGNSLFASDEKRHEAYAITKKYHDSLTPEQSKVFFGENTNEFQHDPDDLRDISRRVHFIEQSENIDELAGSLKNPLMDFKADDKNGEAKILLKAAARKAVELGIYPAEMLKKGIERVIEDLPGKKGEDLDQDKELLTKSILSEISKTSDSIPDGQKQSEASKKQLKITDPKKQKVIDAIVHGVIGDGERKSGDTSPRFDLEMPASDQKRAIRDITKGNYETAAAKKMLAKVMSFEENGDYPIIEGLGGKSVRNRGATPEEIQQNIDDAKSFKAQKLSKEDSEAFNNQSAKELGMTEADFDAHQEYLNNQHEQGNRNPGTIGGNAEPAKEEVQRPENEPKTSDPQDTGSKAAQGKPDRKPSLSDEEAKRKMELRKKFAGRFNDVTNIPTLLADKEFREYAALVFKEAAGDFKAFSKELIDNVGEKIKEHLPGLFKELGGKDDEVGNEVKKTILTQRAYEGEIADDVKKYLEEKGLTRETFTQDERSKQATDFINKFGEDGAFQAVKSGDVDGGMAASILAQLQIRNSEAMRDLPMESGERDELAKKQADYIALMEKKGYLGGEFNGQLAFEFENAELNYANIKKRVERTTGKPLTEAQEKKVKDLTDENEKLKSQLDGAEAKLIEETDKAFKSGEEAAKNETKAQKAKRIAAKLRDNAKIHRPGVFNSATPATIAWDTAVEIVAKSIEAGGKLADAIDLGIDHIKQTNWYKSLPANKKALAESEFKRYSNDNSGSTDLDDLRERFVDKTDNKFTPSEAKDIWGYIKENYLDKGASYWDAISKTADDLGLSWRQVSEAVITPKLKRMSDEMWKRLSDYTRNRTAIKDWVADQNKTKAEKALKAVSGLFRGVAVFGHGGIFMGTHAGMTLMNPSTWNKTIPAFFKGWKFAYGNEGDYHRSMEELKNSPNYLIAQRAGLKNNPDRLNAEEYQNSQKYLGKLGIAGERGFNAVKVLRQGLFDYHYSKLTPAERDDPTTAVSIAHLVNLATGATNVKIPSWVNEASFAGGMEAARWEKLLASPVRATTTALKAIITPSRATTAQRVFAKVWARRVGEQLATYSSVLLANAAIQNTMYPQNKVNLTDPNKPDFLKMKFGDMTIDFTSGMRSTAMFIYTLAKIPFESKKELQGERGIKVAGKDIAGYARGKLAPLYSTVADFFESQDYNSNVMPYSDEKPSGSAHHLSWGEYGTSKLPLPVAEAFSVFYKSALEHTDGKKTLNDVLKGVASGAISGTTGFRTGEYKGGDNEPIDKKIAIIKNDTGDEQKLSEDQVKHRKEIIDKTLSENPKDWTDSQNNRKTFTDDFNESWEDSQEYKKLQKDAKYWKTVVGRSDQYIKDKIAGIKAEKLNAYLEKEALEYSKEQMVDNSGNLKPK